MRPLRDHTPLLCIQHSAGHLTRFGREDQHPHPFPPKPPQQQRRRMIHRQLSLPHPFPLKVLPPHPPQQQRRRMIHRQEDIPFPFSHPHPQFVAVKSLMLNPPVELLFTVLYYAGKRKWLQLTRSVVKNKKLMDENPKQRIF